MLEKAVQQRSSPRGSPSKKRTNSPRRYSRLADADEAERGAWGGGRKIQPAKVQFECCHYAVIESCGAAILIVERSGNLNCKCTVDYATKDGTARAGDDYEGAKGELVFGVGETSGKISVNIVDDYQFEEDESFSVVLSNPRL